MTPRRKSSDFSRLAELQDLAVIEHRRALESACVDTDRRTTEENMLAQDMRSAEAGLDDVYAEERLCPVRLRLAVAIVGASEDALAQGRQALNDAKIAEQEASTDWQSSRHRSRWFAEQARVLRKAEAKRQDEIAEVEARALRLALTRRNAS